MIAFKILENYKPVDDFHKLQAQYLLANVYNSLSQSYAYSLDYETSIKYARKSLQISEKIFPKNPERSAPMVALARGVYAFENKCDSAIYYLDNAITLLEKNNLYGTEMWLSYRSYKVNILARCGKKNEAKILAKNTAETLTNINDTVTPEKANSIILAQALTLNQNADIEFMAKEALLRQEAIITKQEQDKKNAIALEEINR